MILAMAAMMVSRAMPPAHHGSRAGAARAVQRAKGSLVGLFSSDDYPNDALRRGDEGTVGVRLTIGTDGHASRCVVTASSHSPSLDAATCRILTERADFAPALDRRGKPTIDHYGQRITWRIPAAPPILFANTTHALVITVPVSGEPACAMSFTGAPVPTISKAECARLLPGWRSELSILAIDFVAPYRMSFLKEQRLGDPLEALPDPQRTIRGGAALTIAPDGKVSDCRPVAALSLNGDDGASLCDDGRAMQFPALAETDKLRAPRSLTLIRSMRYEPLPPTASGTVPPK